MFTKKSLKIKKGFTLLEVLLYIGIVVIFVSGTVMASWNMIYGNIKHTVQKEVNNNLMLFEKKFRYEVSNASAVTTAATQVNIIPQNSLRGEVVFKLTNNRIMYGEGTTGNCTLTDPCALTGNAVFVSSLSFTDLSNPSDTSKIINYAVSMSYVSTGNRIEWSYDESLSSSVETRSL